MSQNAARHGPRAKSDDEDVAAPRASTPEHQHSRRPRPGPAFGRPDGDDRLWPDEDGGPQPDDDDRPPPEDPDEDEFRLTGDNDLSPVDLGPADPNATDPDADSGRIRRMP
jgi:hypothetical protein